MNIFTFLNVQPTDLQHLTCRKPYDGTGDAADISRVTVPNEVFERIVKNPHDVNTFFDTDEKLKLTWTLKVLCDKFVREAIKKGETVKINAITATKPEHACMVFDSFFPTMPWISGLNREFSPTKNQEYIENVEEVRRKYTAGNEYIQLLDEIGIGVVELEELFNAYEQQYRPIQFFNNPIEYVKSFGAGLIEAYNHMLIMAINSALNTGKKITGVNAHTDKEKFYAASMIGQKLFVS